MRSPAGVHLLVRDLSKSYGNGASGKTPVLRGVSFELRQGEFVAIMGRSGSGKSTLLNVLGGLDTWDAGNFHFNGRDVAAMSAHDLARLRSRHIGFVFQDFNLLPSLTALENALVPFDYADVSDSEARRRSMSALTKLGLADLIGSMPNQLSGGQKQRVAIARAVVNDPEVILADEPTGALDSGSASDVMRIFEGLHADGRSIVIVTHDSDIAAYADRVLVMSDGELISGATAA